jgi:hypothetical protein
VVAMATPKVTSRSRDRFATRTDNSCNFSLLPPPPPFAAHKRPICLLGGRDRGGEPRSAAGAAAVAPRRGRAKRLRHQSLRQRARNQPGEQVGR